MEDLEKKLYDREAGDFEVRRSELGPVYHNVNRNWPDEPMVKNAGQNPWFKVLIGSFLFFLIALGAAYYVFSTGGNVVSEKNITVAVAGPVTVKAGDELSLQIGLTNNNAVPIDQVELTTTWPDGTKVSETGKPLTFQTQKIGVIKPGETVNVAVKAAVFGKENDELELKLGLRYHLAGSNTLFEKETGYRLRITSSPLDLRVSVPTEVNSNQEFALSIIVGANSDKPISDVMIEANYPPGFRLVSSSLPPAGDQNKWRLGDLAPAMTREITLRGVIEGESEQLRAFEFRAGSAAGEAKNIVTVYNDLYKTLTIKKSFLGLSLIDETGAQKFTQKSERPTNYVVRWNNNLPVSVKDIVVTGRFSGNALSKKSVDADRAYYDSSQNTLTWDKHSEPVLAAAEPGAESEEILKFGSLAIAGTVPIKNPFIDLALNVSGTRVSEGFAGERIETNISRTIKIDSEIALLSRALYVDGPFKNSGPLPPKPEQATTYTIAWALNNSSNDLENAAVRAVLPLGVSWVGLSSPATEKIVYDAASRTVIWDLGSLAAGTGFGDTARRTAAFQVSLTPSVSQIGDSAILAREISFTGRDTWTGSLLGVTTRDLTTEISTDSGYFNNSGTISR